GIFIKTGRVADRIFMPPATTWPDCVSLSVRGARLTATASVERAASDGKPAYGLTIAALGVVYGDIGTSPLYAVRQSLVEFGRTDEQAVLGVISLIAWAILLV